MKKVNLILIFAVFITTAYAQNEKHEISLGQGMATIGGIEYLLTLNGRRVVRYGGTGLVYKYSLTNKINIGGGIAYDYAREERKSNRRRLMSTTYYGCALEGDYIYFQNRILRLYGTVGLGIIFKREKDMYYKGKIKRENKTFCFPQFTPMGIKYGEKYGGFIEYGIGYKGTSIGGYIKL